MSDHQRRLLSYLLRAPGWTTAAELAAELAVTPRSVRAYVAAANSASAPLEVVSSSPAGYRLVAENYGRFLASDPGRPASAALPLSPTDRGRQLVRRLAAVPQGLDLYALAAELFVGESTIEADLRRLRLAGKSLGVGFTRHESQLEITGREAEIRQLLGGMFRAESPPGFLSLSSIERAFELTNLAGFETALRELLEGHGFGVNEFALGDVLLEVAVAVSRVRDSGGARGDAVPDVSGPDASGPDPLGPDTLGPDASGRDTLAPDTLGPDTLGPTNAIGAELARLVARQFGVTLPASEERQLAVVVTTRAATRTAGGAAAGGAAAGGIRSAENELVATVVRRVAQEYAVDLANEAFRSKLALHLESLVSRAKQHGYSRNPMARTIKISYPLVYEVAVFIANELRQETQIVVGDDEISYLALHVGLAVQDRGARAERVSCIVLCPSYRELPIRLSEQLESVLGDDLRVLTVLTRTDDPTASDPAVPSADLLLSTVALDGGSAGLARPRNLATAARRVVAIHPFLTENDVANVRHAIGVVRRERQRAPARAKLPELFAPALFARNLEAASPEEMIRTLGERMITAGVITPESVEGAIARETLSSTAFTDTLAVPHPFARDAHRSAIAIAVNETALPWGESRVNAVALLVLSPGDQSMFPQIFNLLTAAFADRASTQRLIARSVDFAAFMSELQRTLDA